MSILRNALLPLIGLLPLAAWADYDQQYQACLDASAMINNTSVAGCAEGVSETVKKEMNRVYQQLFLKLQEGAPQDAEQLETAQKAWLVYRNGQCDLQGKHVGSPMYYTCPMQMNIQRVEELKLLLENGG
ncbi:lysozyme inhibitor LprI family protein [Pseudomonas sp.]|uniref:lysozyme inhibitor LprI family protein n=1 Tax=Pseudomonas sp. TaxID=306 RepID=UPI003A96959A